jgi:hypothetical protein
MTMALDVEAIDALLRDAFGNVPKPTREALINEHCDECFETSEAFAGKTWNEITLDDVLRGRETALLTAAAWRYYLPAVIRWCLRDREAVDVIADNVVNQLAPPDPEQFSGQRAYFEERATGFDDRQRAVIVAFLERYQEADAAAWRGTATTSVYAPLVERALAFWSAPR